jgi:hypothetical protein
MCYADMKKVQYVFRDKRIESNGIIKIIICCDLKYERWRGLDSNSE